MERAKPNGKPPRAKELRAPSVWTVRLLVLLLILAAAGAVVPLLDRMLGLGLFPAPLTRQLRRAADAVLPDRQADAAEDSVQAAAPGGGAFLSVPRAPAFDRRQAVGLILDLDAMRSECGRAVAQVRAMDYLSAEGGHGEGQLAQIAGLWDGATSRLGEFLAVERERARVILAALGWPWLGDEGPTPADLDPPGAPRPGAFRDMPGGVWQSVLERAAAEEPWPRVAASLASRRGLGARDIRALQAFLCRRDVGRAFRSRADMNRAQQSLARLASLTAGQTRTVMAMAAVRELLQAGAFALPVLIDMLETDPGLALPILHECIRRMGVREQARLAAVDLGGVNTARAERVLIALGPFGAEAVAAMAAVPEGPRGSAAARVLSRIGADWASRGSSALAELGTDPQRWRRWYEQAREAL